MADDTATEIDIPALVAAAIAESNPKATTSARERLLIGVLTVILGGGSAGGVMAAGWKLLPPHPQVAVQARALEVHTVEFAELKGKITALEAGQVEIKAIARETFDIVDRKHPQPPR